MILSTACTPVKMLSSTNQYCVLLNFIYFLIMAYVLFSEKKQKDLHLQDPEIIKAIWHRIYILLKTERKV